MDSFRMVEAIGNFRVKINYLQTKDMEIGASITSPIFQVGGHNWAIKYFPQGNNKYYSGKYVSVLLQLKTEATNVTANIRLSLVNKYGCELSAGLGNVKHTFTSRGNEYGFPKFVQRTFLEQPHIKDDYFVLYLAVTVKDESCAGICYNSSPIDFPRNCLQKFREEKKHTDVSFHVDGNIFVAHRFILALHSPVFEAELFGSMAESNMDCITINEMMPTIFKAMLDFMYSGLFPVNDEVNDGNKPMSSISFLQHLLAAADRFAVEKLRSMCEKKLIDNISLDTVLNLLGFGDKHNCTELKKECLKFIVDKDNLVSLLLTEGYIKLMQECPSLLTEIKEMVDEWDTIRISKLWKNQNIGL